MKQRTDAAYANRVRIIAGDWRGTRLTIPPGVDVRPTPDRVRETLFNWLAAEVAGSRCLDAFAGSGALGLEALSRGAAEVWFLERDARLADGLRAQLQRLGGRGQVITGDARQWLRSRSATEPQHDAAQPPGRADFDLVFLDPPYDVAIEPLLALLTPWLAERALVYVERALGSGLPAAPDGARWARQARAGRVSFGLLEYSGTAL